MTTLPALGNQMFLSDKLPSYTALVRREHLQPLTFALRLNEVAHEALFSAKVVRSDLQQLLLVTLLQRAMTSYQAAILLWERGLPQEGQVVLRTLLEVTFKTVAIARHADVAERYVREDEALRRKLINKYKLLSADAQDPEVLQQLDELLRGREEEISAHGIRDLTTYWFAEKAELLDFYNSAYAVLSTQVHASARTLERSLRIGDQSEIASLQYGFSDEDLDQHVLTATEALLLAISAAFSKGDIPASSVAAIDEMYAELHRQHKVARGET